MPDPLTMDEVRHVAKLARLSLSEAQLESYRTQLSAVLDHVAMLGRLDLEGVEPMTRPTPPDHAMSVNRLDDDTVEPSMPIEMLLHNAPQGAIVADRYIAVPKVLGGDS